MWINEQKILPILGIRLFLELDGLMKTDKQDILIIIDRKNPSKILYSGCFNPDTAILLGGKLTDSLCG